jgi:serine/threonine protein kinase/tetratricopeptide (TPR) repeat protein
MNSRPISCDDDPAAPGSERLDTVLAEYLEAERLGRAPTRADWLAGHPDLTAELSAFLDDRDCFRRLAAAIPPAPSACLDGPEAGPPEWRMPDVVGGYEILGELGRGGMGVVYKARQPQLGRLVALKMVLDGRHADPRELARFRAEAEAIARLQHPNIVQIHEVGTHEGRPFFSLELVEGGTLAQRIAGRPQPTRESAALVETLARAVAYAHRQGVVHRDLKPGNILLQKKSEIPSTKSEARNPKSEKDDGAVSDFGIGISDLGFRISDFEPKVTDFGLAKRLEGREGQTRTGAIVGTPAYLAPEQARGQRDVGPAADVYALGAILYELLTGRPPFRGETPLDTLWLVTGQEVVPPGRRCARVPRDLETICLKCLEKDPAWRYATAADLADDLARFLRGEAVAARPIGGLERLARWCRRRPLVAGLLAAVAVLALAGVGGVTVQWRRAEAHLAEARRKGAEAEQQRAEAERQRARAEATVEQMRKVVDEFFTTVSDSTLLNVPGMQPLRKVLLERARRYYRDFVAQHRDNPRLRYALAEAQFRLGRVLSVIESKAAGIRQMEISRATLQSLLREQPGSILARQNLATCQLAIGRLQYDLGRHADALRSAEAAYAVLKKLYHANPRASERASSLDFACTMLGILHQDLGHLDRATAYFDQSRALAEAEVRLRPTALGRMKVVRSQYALAQLHLARGQVKEARGLYRRAVQGAERLVQENRASISNRQLLAELYSTAGSFGFSGPPNAPLTAEDFEKMRVLAEKARALLAGLVKENPTVIEYRVSLAITLHNLGRAQQLLHRYPEAIRNYTEAADRLARVLGEDRTLFKAHLTLAEVRDRLGECQLQAGRPAEAERTLARARAALEDLLRQYPGRLDLRTTLANVLGHWAQAAERQGRKELALAACEKAASLQRAVFAALPADLYHRGQLTRLLAELVRMHVELKRPRKAAAVCRERLALCAGQAAGLYAVGRDLAQCASLVGSGPEHEALVGQAVRALRQAVQAGFADRDRWVKDAALDPLRGHSEVRRLHERVQARARGR